MKGTAPMLLLVAVAGASMQSSAYSPPGDYKSSKIFDGIGAVLEAGFGPGMNEQDSCLPSMYWAVQNFSSLARGQCFVQPFTNNFALESTTENWTPMPLRRAFRSCQARNLALRHVERTSWRRSTLYLPSGSSARSGPAAPSMSTAEAEARGLKKWHGIDLKCLLSCFFREKRGSTFVCAPHSHENLIFMNLSSSLSFTVRSGVE